MYTDDLFGGRPPSPGFPPRNPVDELAVSVRKNAADIASHAADAGAHVTTGEKAAWNAKADLVDGKIPQEQLPSYVDDVLEYAALSSFPQAGETGKIYVDTSTGRTYRWSGSVYVQIGGEEQVQADWTQTDASAASFIKNKPTIPAAVTVDSALSDSSTNPVQNKVVTTALNGKATAAQGAKADAALSRAEAVAGFTEWTYSGLPAGATEIADPVWNSSYLQWEFGFTYDGDVYSSNASGSETDTDLEFVCDNTTDPSQSQITVTATRTRLPTMADIPTDNAQLTNGAGYATTTAMNAALAGKADAGAVRYDLPTANAEQDMTAPMLPPDAFPVNVNGTDYTKSQISFSKTGDTWFMQAGNMEDVFAWSAAGVPDSSPISATVAFGELTNPPSLMFPYILLDRTMNQLALQTLPASGIALSFPAAQTGKVRDFLVRLTTPAGDAPQIAYPSDVKFGNGAAEFPEINTTDTTGATAETILMFTETAPYVANATPAKFLVKGEAWNEIGGAQ